jgi:hypothetical protein
LVHLVDAAERGGVPFGHPDPPIFPRRAGIMEDHANMQVWDMVSDPEHINMFGLNH